MRYFSGVSSDALRSHLQPLLIYTVNTLLKSSMFPLWIGSQINNCNLSSTRFRHLEGPTPTTGADQSLVSKPGTLQIKGIPEKGTVLQTPMSCWGTLSSGEDMEESPHTSTSPLAAAPQPPVLSLSPAVATVFINPTLAPKPWGCRFIWGSADEKWLQDCLILHIFSLCWIQWQPFRLSIQ